MPMMTENRRSSSWQSQLRSGSTSYPANGSNAPEPISENFWMKPSFLTQAPGRKPGAGMEIPRMVDHVDCDPFSQRQTHELLGHPQNGDRILGCHCRGHEAGAHQRTPAAGSLKKNRPFRSKTSNIYFSTLSWLGAGRKSPALTK